MPPLLLDLYELTMAQSYWSHGVTAPASFSLTVRHLPPGWAFFVVAGLEDVLAYLERFGFTDDALAYLRTTNRFTPDFLAALGALRFHGTVRAMPEGTTCFPDEPLLEVTAPIIEAQLIETVVINLVHFQTLVASKAARCVQAAQGRRLVEFGLRRTHGTDAALKVARAAYLAGFESTSNVLAGQRYGIPIAGTMAHSFIEAFPDELTAFRAYARSYPDAAVLLIDTYDTLAGACRAAVVGQELAAAGHRLRGVRLDSGDVIALSRRVRQILDQAGLADATIFLSGHVDERAIADVVAVGAPVDAFGVGTRLAVSADAPYLDMTYKLVAYDGRPTLKLSAAKATWPGAKQVWRNAGTAGALDDLVALAEEPAPPGREPLLVDVMRDGRPLHPVSLTAARARAAAALAALPPAYAAIDASVTPAVAFSARLRALRDQVARTAGRGATSTA